MWIHQIPASSGAEWAWAYQCFQGFICYISIIWINCSIPPCDEHLLAWQMFPRHANCTWCLCQVSHRIPNQWKQTTPEFVPDQNETVPCKRPFKGCFVFGLELHQGGKQTKVQFNRVSRSGNTSCVSATHPHPHCQVLESKLGSKHICKEVRSVTLNKVFKTQLTFSFGDASVLKSHEALIKTEQKSHCSLLYLNQLMLFRGRSQ